jgi:2-polyprenyl-3-methyl-5-hydroxy-6-metoxy-1,4-benzoquinol methylase
MTTTQTVSDDRATRRDALAGRLFEATLGALELQSVYLGDRLGLYQALADGGPATSGDLAERAGIAERYAREWLEQQAVAGFLDVDDVAADPSARRYALPPAHADVLVDPLDLATMAPMARLVVGGAQRMPDLLAAYRTGSGVDWADYGPDVVEGQEAINRPQFRHLVGSWIDGLPDIADRLRDGEAPRVADVGCGTGWSSIEIARAFPRAQVDGIDVDRGSIDRAREHATAEGLDDRVRLIAMDPGAAAMDERYDLVTIFEAVHDMAQPVDVLAAARRMLRPGGAVLVGDERVAERFVAPGDETERLMYGYSVVFCLANGLATQPSVGTGTVLRPAAVEAMARDAGFARSTILPIEHDTFRFYRLDP